MSRIAGWFTRVESRRRARKLVLGLLSDLPRENCWTIAEWAGDRTPDGMQHLLGRAKWDADQVRDDEAVLVVDETGDVKKGTDTVGVQRQYTGHRAACGAGDEVYGGNPRLRAALEERGTGYVLAVACSHEVTTGAGKFRADTPARKVSKSGWRAPSPDRRRTPVRARGLVVSAVTRS